MKKRISIIGCGWLGMPLAKRLANDNFVMATTRNADKVEELKKAGIGTVYIASDSWNLPHEITHVDWLIYLIPPSSIADYVSFTKKILDQFPSTTKVIFTSSIGVYLPSLAIINEQSNIKENHPLAKVEQLIHQTFDKAYVLRLAGLINEQRNPIYYLSGRENPNPNQVVNLVHQEDVITAIQSILAEQPVEQTFNICYPAHPSRQEYYTQQAQQLNLPLPIFTNQNELGKQIEGNHIEQMTSFRYRTSIFNKK